MATLKQIAAHVGVSVRTVSVVLNDKGREQRISTAVIEKIKQVAADMRYRPNVMARATRLRKTSQIGVLVSELSNPHTGANVEAIERNLLKHGYKLLLGLTNRSRRTALAYLEDFSSGMVDGVLNLDPLVDDELIEASKLRVPYFHFLRSSPKYHFELDFKGGVDAALHHLSELGHEKIGFISGPQRDISTHERLTAFNSFVQRNKKGGGCPVIFGDWTLDSGRKAARPLIDAGCSAILGANDLMAVGAMKAAQRAGLKVPQQLSIVGFDNSLIAEISEPPLTSVHLPMDVAADAFVEALLGRIKGKTRHGMTLLKPELVIRNSTSRIRS